MFLRLASIVAQDTITIAWTIRQPIRAHNNPIEEAELYQLGYIPLNEVEHASTQMLISILFPGAAGPSISRTASLTYSVNNGTFSRATSLKSNSAAVNHCPMQSS